jgi:DNA-binding protein HU-beta
MNKKQLSVKVAEKLKMKKNSIEKILDTTLNIIAEALASGEKVRLVGFGNFIVRTRAPRIGRNPQTGAKIDIPSTKSAAFVSGINLKAVVKK